jgi:glutamine amidotransferase-like uncharacterized protein
MKLGFFLVVVALLVDGMRTLAVEPAVTSVPPLRVAIYADKGGNDAGPTNCERCLPKGLGFATRRITAEEIQAGALKDFDVLIQPGGSGSKQAAELGEAGREQIRKFVRDGGGYVGICAGAYLASADYDWSLHLLDAKVVDRKHWARGYGEVRLKAENAEAKKFLGIDGDLLPIYYHQGPLLAPAEKDDIPDYERIATFETEIAKNGAPEGVMKGTTAAARAPFGKGRVFCYSPHPERTPGLDRLIEQAVRWTAAK